MKQHELKTVNPFFQDMWVGRKTFEIRKNDRDFQQCDELKLLEYFPDSDAYSGRSMRAIIVHMVTSEDFPDGLKEGYAVLSVEVLERSAIAEFAEVRFQ